MNYIEKIDHCLFKTINLSKHKLKKATLVSVLAILPSVTVQAATIEEVVVTAQKRTESAQDVPISISALGAEDIEKFGIVDVYDLRGAVPGLEIRQATAIGNPTFTIRGVGATNFDTISGSVVATYIDDIPQVSSGQLNFTTFDLANIEVLKGPQGTLFGAGTTAGVVHFKTNKPTKEFGGYLKTGVGNFGKFNVEGAVTGALTDDWSGRLSTLVETFDGYYFNNATNSDTGGLDSVQLRGQLLRETDNSDILINVHYSDAESEAILYQLVPLLADDGTGTAVTCPVIQTALDRGRLTEADERLANTQSIDIFGTSNTGNGVDDPYTSDAISSYGNDNAINLENFGASLRADIDLGGTTLTTITGIETTEHGGVDPEGPLGRAGAFDVLWLTEVSMFTQELRLASNNDDSPWIIGMSVIAHEIENDLRSQLNFNAFGQEGNPFILEAPAATLAGSQAYSAPQTQDTVEIGIFAQTDWHLKDNLTAVTGIRAATYEKENTVAAIGVAAFPEVTTKLNEDSVSFNFGLNYTPQDDLLLYGKLSQGVRSGSHAGGFKFSPDSVPGAEQETLLSYEVGAKSTLLDGSMQLNGAAFFYDYQDVQSLSQRLVGNTFVQQYTNVGDAEVTGFEFDVVWAPIEQLLFKLGATFLDSEVVKSDPGISVDFTGNSLANSPDTSYSLLARYTVPVGGYDLSLQYDSSFIDDQFRNVDNSALDFDESTTIQNFVATLGSDDGNLEFSAYVKNLSDELDMTWQFTFGGAQRRSYNAPRTYGVSATYRW